MLDLPAEVENTLREYARAEGVTVAALLARTFPPRRVPDDDPVLLFLRARLAEAENATSDEVAADNAAYRQWQQSLGAPRRASGERLLCPEVEQP